MYKMYLISAEGYKNAKFGVKTVRKTREIWPSLKDVRIGMGVKTYLIYIQKKYMANLKQKTLQKSGLTNTK